MSQRAATLGTDMHDTPPPQSSLRDLVERALFYLGVPALTLYPLGLLYYYIQFSVSYGISSLSAWHAVFQIPREQIVLRMLSLLTLGSVATLAVGILSLGTLLAFTIGWRYPPGTSRLRRVLKRFLLSILTF